MSQSTSELSAVPVSALDMAQKAKAAQASACGKAILVGEHGVVYGSHAVAIPLRQMRLTVKVSSPSRREGARTVISSGHSQQESFRKHLQEILREASEILNIDAEGHVIHGCSDLPVGAGVGSSAALCVATLRALCQGTERPLPVDRLASLANLLEKRFHGTPSGLDTSVVAHETPVLFSKAGGAEIISTPKNEGWYFALVDSGVRAATKTMIQVASTKFEGSQGAQRLIEFDHLARVARTALGAGDAAIMAEVMASSHKLLEDIGVVTARLSEIITQCYKLRCLAAKSTGAGGGGVVLVLLNPGQFDKQLTELRTCFGPSSVSLVAL